MWFNAQSVPIAKTSIRPSALTAVASWVIPPLNPAQPLQPPPALVCQMWFNALSVPIANTLTGMDEEALSYGAPQSQTKFSARHAPGIACQARKGRRSAASWPRSGVQ